MPKETHTLKVGDTLELAGKVTVLKCGMRREGAAPPVPTVTLEVETPELAPEGATGDVAPAAGDSSENDTADNA